MRNLRKLTALLVLPLAALAAGAAQGGSRPKLVLRLGTDAENCRNSEGDFILLRNGDILFAYSKYLKGRGDDHDMALIAARRSFDGGEHWTTNDVVLAEADGHRAVPALRQERQRVFRAHAARLLLRDGRADNLLGDPQPLFVHEQAGEMLLDRRPTADDVAAAVSYLLDAESVTGTVIPVDAGQHLVEV